MRAGEAVLEHAAQLLLLAELLLQPHGTELAISVIHGMPCTPSCAALDGCLTPRQHMMSSTWKRSAAASKMQSSTQYSATMNPN